MEKLLEVLGKTLLLCVGLLFYPWILLTIYNWFSPHVGFELPELTYLNMFAISILTIILNPDRLFIATRQLKIKEWIKGSEDTSDWIWSIVTMFGSLFLLAILYLELIILF